MEHIDPCSNSKVGVSDGREEQTISVQVRYGIRTFRIDVRANPTLYDLKDAIEKETHVVPRLQKLCCQGNVLKEDMQLHELVRKNAKILLLPMGPGSQVTSLGSERMKEHMLSKRSKPEKTVGQGQVVRDNCLITQEARKRRWQATKIASLLDLGLNALPLSCFDPSMQLRAVDISGNPVRKVPEQFIESLSCVRKLRLDRCELDSDSMDWSMLAKYCQHLEYLSLEGNRLTSVPMGIGGLRSLQTLQIGYNNIKHISSGHISQLNRLALLNLSDNIITSISENAFPLSLEVLYLQKNDLRLLPPMRLSNLKMLQLECNTGCVSLDSAYNMFPPNNELTINSRSLGCLADCKPCPAQYSRTCPNWLF